MDTAEKDIGNYLVLIEKCIYNNPLPLLQIKHEGLLNLIDSYLPYSIGMEFECVKSRNYDINHFKNIPDIMAIDVDSSEQRYRIPPGLKGLVVLWKVCEALKINSIVDLESSNHYHFDFTDLTPDERGILATKENKNLINEELKKWNTALNYNHISNWTRFFNSLGTLEIRIGEPTFEYSKIVKRLIDGCRISKMLKSQVVKSLENYNSLIAKIDANLKSLDMPDISFDVIESVVKNRVIKI